MFLFFLLIQDTCPFFGECVIYGASQHVTGHLLLMPFQIGLSGWGLANWTPTHTHKKTWAAEYTKFEEFEVS